MTFKSETERNRVLQFCFDLQKKCTSDAQYRVYAEREREIREAKIVKPSKPSAPRSGKE